MEFNSQRNILLYNHGWHFVVSFYQYDYYFITWKQFIVSDHGKKSSQGSVLIYFSINPATDSCIVMKGYSVFI